MTCSCFHNYCSMVPFISLQESRPFLSRPDASKLMKCYPNTNNPTLKQHNLAARYAALINHPYQDDANNITKTPSQKLRFVFFPAYRHRIRS